MPRVNRNFVLLLLLVGSCAFLLFQLHYYRKYVSKQTGFHVLNPASHVTSSDVQWQLLKKFLSLAQHFRLPLFLADIRALTLLSQDALQQHNQMPHDPQCIFLCTGQPVTSFALYANLWKYDVSDEFGSTETTGVHQPGFLLAAQQRGFELLELQGEDPRLASLDTLSGREIPLHFLFRLHGYTIHVVLLYERSGNYLWHGAVRLKANMDQKFAPFQLLDYGHHAGAYDRLELILTVVDGLDVQLPQNISNFLMQHQHARFLECRHQDARRFLQLYPDDSSAAAHDFRRKAKLLLSVAAQTLAVLHVPFWISSGTCLGWFRQCNIISYSQDVDIGIFISDFRPDIVAAFRDAGLSLKHKFGKVEDSLELSFLSDDVKLDIFFFYKHEGVMWNGGTQAKSGRKFKYVFAPFTLCWAELLEVKVRVPCETLDYVMANYGVFWNVPVRSWDWKTSPRNVIENGMWPSKEWAELIQVY